MSTIPCHRGGHTCRWPACEPNCEGRPGVAEAVGRLDTEPVPTDGRTAVRDGVVLQSPPRPFRVLVTGGRNFRDQPAVCRALAALLDKHGRLVVIQGGASGADQCARAWAMATPLRFDRVELINEPARWFDLDARPLARRRRGDGKMYNAAAGGIRNQLMLDRHKPDLVLAFAGGPGTADMVKRAEAAGVEVRRTG